MPVLDFVNFYLVPGLVLGSIYAVGAIGITMVFGILRFAHLAHGDMATMGAYLALGGVAMFGLNPWFALPFAMALTGLIAVGADRAFYEHLRERPRILMVMASLGVALMLRSLVQVIWGVDPVSYERGIVRPEAYFGIMLRPRELYTVLSVVIMLSALTVFLQKSRWGKAMRAVSDNADLARVCGVDSRKVTALTWLIAGSLCAAAGFMKGINTELNTMMGWFSLLPMFAAAILGGVGRVEGAVLGGLLVGMVEELSVIFLPGQYKAAVAFAIILLILLVRPRGLLNGKVL